MKRTIQELNLLEEDITDAFKTFLTSSALPSRPHFRSDESIVLQLPLEFPSLWPTNELQNNQIIRQASRRGKVAQRDCQITVFPQKSGCGRRGNFPRRHRHYPVTGGILHMTGKICMRLLVQSKMIFAIKVHTHDTSKQLITTETTIITCNAQKELII